MHVGTVELLQHAAMHLPSHLLLVQHTKWSISDEKLSDLAVPVVQYTSVNSNLYNVNGLETFHSMHCTSDMPVVFAAS